MFIFSISGWKGFIRSRAEKKRQEAAKRKWARATDRLTDLQMHLTSVEFGARCMGHHSDDAALIQELNEKISAQNAEIVEIKKELTMNG
jgi:hypothetical protein